MSDLNKQSSKSLHKEMLKSVRLEKLVEKMKFNMKKRKQMQKKIKMDKIRISGNSNLFGAINVSGSKNAALPILVSSLLSKNDLVLKNIPKLEDIKSMIKLLQGFGVKCTENKEKIILNAKK